MTIRLRCAECQRKLKVPDEALGKKVQCPACGARFLGYLEADAPPPAPADEPPTTPFPNLQLLEAAGIEEIEPIAVPEPAAGDETEVMEALAPEEEGVEPIVMEDDPFQDLAQVADETDAIDVVDEVEDESEIVDEDEPPTKKKKSRGMLYLLLALGVVLLLACGGLGAVYLLFWS